MQDVIEFLSGHFKPGDAVSPTHLRNLLTKFADQHGEAYYGDEIFWLEFHGHMTPFPHIWRGSHAN